MKGSVCGLVSRLYSVCWQLGEERLERPDDCFQGVSIVCNCLHLPACAVLQQLCQASIAEPPHSDSNDFMLPFQDCHYICSILHLYHSLHAWGHSKACT